MFINSLFVSYIYKKEDVLTKLKRFAKINEY